MRMLSAAAVVVLLTAPAYAQTPNINLMPELMSKSPEEKEAEAVKDKAYRESLTDAKVPSIPGAPCGTARPGPQRRRPRRARPAAAAAPGRSGGFGRGLIDLRVSDANRSHPDQSGGFR